MKYYSKALIFAAILLAIFGIFILSKSKDLNVAAETLFEQKDSITLAFTGDMMFDRGVRKTIDAKGFDTVFGDSKKIFSNADLVIANLEGPITSYPSRILMPDGSTSKELNFTFPAGTAKALKDHNVDIVNLANNHTANQGQEGLKQTRAYLNESGVNFFGDPGNRENLRATTTCQNNFCISFIGYHEFAGTPASDINKDIKALREKSDIVVVLPHWGVEYVKEPSSSYVNLAHQWIDAGADIVIGTHPHVIQTIEEYKGKAIFYSLGNYIFDQYFSFDTTHGLVVEVEATKTKNASTTFEYKLIPIRNVGTVVSIPNATTSLRILSDTAKVSKTIPTKSIMEGNFSLSSE